MSSQRIRGAALAGLMALLIGVQSAAGQNAAARALATREDLQALLANRQLPGRDRAIIEHRLEAGDFKPGDRVFLTVRGEQALTDTFTVQNGPNLQLPDQAPLPLHGVLRSELQAKVTEHVSQYLRTPTVFAQALLRIGILGAVVRPGYYNVRADQPLADMLTVAGGLAGDGELKKTSLSRNGAEYWPREEVRRALASGKSLDVLGLQGGDELQVGRRGAGFAATFGIITGVVGLTTTVILLTRN